MQEELDEFWFLTDPNDFNAFCHAAQPHWQLLEQPWSDEDFLTTPRYAEVSMAVIMRESTYAIMSESTPNTAVKHRAP